MSSHTYDFADLFGAWREQRRFADAHSDLGKHAARRYAAFAAAFGADLDVRPDVAPPRPDWMHEHMAELGFPPDERWHELMHDFVLQAESDARRLSGPFDGWLELPAEMIAAYARFGQSIADPLDDARDAIGDLLETLLAALFPKAAGRVVGREELLAHGFDPAGAEPDPDDYL